MPLIPSFDSFSDFVAEVGDRLYTDKHKGISWAGLRTYQRLCIDNFPERFDYEWTNAFEREWDILVLLDACRVDLIEAVVDQYDFLEAAERETVYSPSGASYGWMNRTLTRNVAPEMGKTIYVTGNPHTEFIETADKFAELDEVWRTTWNDETGTVPAKELTDRGIWHWRSSDAERMIVHYMQPHFPSVPCPEIGSGIDIDRIGSKWEGNVWDRLRRGELDKERVWEAYRLNLEYVLEEVEVLLNNVDAKRAVISADHGNAMGEYGFYGHGKYPLESVRKVPWYTVSANDRRTRDPERPTSVDRDDDEVRSKLRALGYID
ncbi:hypothetical protein [Natronoarchaeum rubrum]|uniref:hypothetical protein n=1 Tax=Natronoarchaeum rubrum TaxID=755311 RepID=UPI0021120DA8|nr:hypothetical protein [Natronoarchaeum rubrum]